MKNEPIPLSGVSNSVKKIRKKIAQISKYDVTVLIQGETGVGKEVVANWIHYLSKRKNEKFVPINAGAIPANLMESELFGYEKGAFTGAKEQKPGKLEAANNGSLFLDEIGELSLNLQVKLLRVIQEKSFHRLGGNKKIEIDVRFIASTNRDLRKMIREKKFREDLFYRLNVISILIPPLRERKEDIPDLVDYFFKEELGFLPEIDQEVYDFFKVQPWYGNVRELINNLKRISIFLKNKEKITLSDAKPHVKNLKIYTEEEKTKFINMSYKKAVEKFRKEYLLSKLDKNNWNQKKTAEEMGIQPSYLSRLIKKYNIKKENKVN